MAAVACLINTGILFTNDKFPSIHPESVPRSSPRANTYRYAEKKNSIGAQSRLDMNERMMKSGVQHHSNKGRNESSSG